MNAPWICPRCDTVNAPFTASCSCKPQVMTQHSVTAAIKLDLESTKPPTDDGSRAFTLTDDCCERCQFPSWLHSPVGKKCPDLPLSVSGDFRCGSCLQLMRHHNNGECPDLRKT